MEKLSLRLQTILEMVDANAVVADVGSDHGKLMISLYEKGIIQKGYAIENKKGPYNRLQKALLAADASCITPLFSDGISDLPNDVDTVVIAGMGGRTIIEIIKSHLEKLNGVRNFIIDGHSCIPEIRKEITELGYFIKSEKILKEDGIFYEIIKFSKGNVPSYSNDDIEFGPLLLEENNQTFKDKYLFRINEIDMILTKDIPEDIQNKLILEKDKLLKVIKNEN